MGQAGRPLWPFVMLVLGDSSQCRCNSTPTTWRKLNSEAIMTWTAFAAPQVDEAVILRPGVCFSSAIQ